MTIKILNKPSPKLLTTWYAKQVVAGKIIANKYVIKECERHLKYLKGHEKWILMKN